MNYEVSFREDIGAVCFRQLAPLTVEDVHAVVPVMLGMVEGKAHRYVLVDLSQAKTGVVDKEARQAFRDVADPKNFEKLAVFGASPSIRMLAKVVLTISGVSKITQFFKTEAEAVRWLKGNAE